MELTLHHFNLRTRHPFTIARGTTTISSTLVVELAQDGKRGYGEAPECDYYGATMDRVTNALEKLRPLIEKTRLEDPTAFWASTHAVLADVPFAHCALDLAAHDLWGKLLGAPVWRLWGLSLDNLPPTDYTIGIDSIDVMLAKMDEFPGWPIYKIKLGTPNDMEVLRRLREHTDATFRVDANCAWTADQTIANAQTMKDLGVEFIEQPLVPEDWSGMQRVFRESALPVIADESCRNEGDVDRCAECFHGINVKLAKCGGLTPARRMIARANELGRKTMVGCFTESTVGISAIAQLLPLLDYVDMDGALLLGEDIATGVTIERGQVKFPEENGCGIRLVRSGTQAVH